MRSGGRITRNFRLIKMIEKFGNLTDKISVLAQSGTDPIPTAVGDVTPTVEGVVNKFVSIGVGVGGVAAIGLMIYGGIMLLTSSGEPEKLMEGREILTNAIMGLALIVLSVFVLEFLGFNVLNISELTGVGLNAP